MIDFTLPDDIMVQVRALIAQADKDKQPQRGRTIYLTGRVGSLYGCELVLGDHRSRLNVRLAVEKVYE